MSDCCLASLKLKMSPFSSVDAPLLSLELCQYISQVVFNTDSAYSYLWEHTCVRTHVNTNWACWRRSLSMCGREEKGLPKHSSAGDIHWSLGLIGWGRLVCSKVQGEFVDGSVWEVSRSKNTNIKYSVFHLRREAWSLSHFEHLWFLTQRCVALGMNSWAVSQCVLMLKFVALPCSTSIGVTYYYYFTFQIEVVE